MKLRCTKCGKFLGKIDGTADAEIKCPRCGTLNKYSIKLTDIDREEGSETI
ncbi:MULTISPECIES: Com family DNA-binding transcriptional regulator [Clostridium]|uniref:Com family DNA-binding transcriptional regulator n=1 Tax=Clostridium lapidicellarium TaxID=3240931 RepID=A0ABV4DVT8_9CLOT